MKELLALLRRSEEIEDQANTCPPRQGTDMDRILLAVVHGRSRRDVRGPGRTTVQVALMERR